MFSSQAVDFTQEIEALENVAPHPAPHLRQCRAIAKRPAVGLSLETVSSGARPAGHWQRGQQWQRAQRCTLLKHPPRAHVRRIKPGNVTGLLLAHEKQSLQTVDLPIIHERLHPVKHPLELRRALRQVVHRAHALVPPAQSLRVF